MRGEPGVGNPRQPGYQSAEVAYKLISTMPFWAVQLVSEGWFPEHWDEKAQANVDCEEWGNRGLPTMQEVRAANEFISAMTKGSPGVLNDRMDGAVSQRLNVGVKTFVMETPPKAVDAAAWEKLFGPTTATATVEPSE